MTPDPKIGERFENFAAIILKPGDCVYGRISFNHKIKELSKVAIEQLVIIISNNEPITIIDLEYDSFSVEKLLKSKYNIQKTDFTLPLESSSYNEITIHFTNTAAPSVKFWQECARCLKIGGILTVFEKPPTKTLLDNFEILPRGIFLEQGFEGNESHFSSKFRRGIKDCNNIESTGCNELISKMFL